MVFQKNETLTETTSTSFEEDLKASFLRINNGMRCNYLNPSDSLLRAISTSRDPISHSNEAADYGRKQYMAL